MIEYRSVVEARNAREAKALSDELAAQRTMNESARLTSNPATVPTPEKRNHPRLNESGQPIFKGRVNR